MPVDIDFSPLGDLYNTYRQGQQRAARERVLGQLGQGSGPLDYNAVARQLLAVDPEAGLSLARLGQQQEQQQFSRGIQERQTSLAEQQAKDAARGFDYREIDDGQGNKVLVKIDKASGTITRPDIAGAQTVPNNPFQQGKMNEAQSKDALYASRMIGAEKVLRSIDNDVATDRVQSALGTVSDKIGYNLRSAEFQKFDQARRDFINATLRRESGAVISESEFANARLQYFPQAGDTPDVIKQKRLNRMEAIRGIGAGAGPGYRPEMTFDPSGELVPNPAAKSKSQTQSAGRTTETIAAARANPQATIAEAKAAIAAGKDPAAVKQMLQRILGSGADLSGL